jgi:hypothetical protein
LPEWAEQMARPLGDQTRTDRFWDMVVYRTKVQGRQSAMRAAGTDRCHAVLQGTRSSQRRWHREHGTRGSRTEVDSHQRGTDVCGPNAPKPERLTPELIENREANAVREVRGNSPVMRASFSPALPCELVLAFADRRRCRRSSAPQDMPNAQIERAYVGRKNWVRRDRGILVTNVKLLLGGYPQHGD